MFKCSNVQMFVGSIVPLLPCSANRGILNLKWDASLADAIFLDPDQGHINRLAIDVYHAGQLFGVFHVGALELIVEGITAVRVDYEDEFIWVVGMFAWRARERDVGFSEILDFFRRLIYLNGEFLGRL